jgi:hypothetical protein
VPGVGEEDRNGTAEPLDVAVEMREELLLLAGGHERVEQDDGIGRLVVHASDIRRRPAPEPTR